jgi:hypothetical protein
VLPLKIKDRLWLSLIAGLGGTVVKSLLIRGAKANKWAEFNGAETAAGMLLPAHKIYTTSGKIVGEVANLIVGTLFSVPIIYVLSLTGKDKALTKGAALGSTFWVILYGSMANMGLSTIRPAMPHTMLTQLFGHAVFGGTVSFIATTLGDPGLFDGTIPVFVGSGGDRPPQELPQKQSGMSPYQYEPEELSVSPH